MNLTNINIRKNNQVFFLSVAFVQLCVLVVQTVFVLLETFCYGVHKRVHRQHHILFWILNCRVYNHFYDRVYRLLSLRQVEDQQVEGAAMLVYADLDVESLERRRPRAHPRGNYVPTEYADIDFIRSAGMDRGSNLYANQERVVCIDHESAEYSNC